MHRPATVDALPVHANTGEAAQILDVDVTMATHEPSVLSRYVLFVEPNDVLLGTADRELVSI